MEYYKHEFSRKTKDLEKYLNFYFISDEEIKNLKLKKNEIHFINLLKLHFIYRVELTKSTGNFSAAIYYVIQNHRAKFENENSNIKDNKFYIVTNTEIKKHLKNKYNFKIIAKDAVKQIHGYGGEFKYYQIIKIISKNEAKN